MTTIDAILDAVSAYRAGAPRGYIQTGAADTAAQFLAAALMELPWGEHPRGCFLTDTSGWPGDVGTRVLWRHGRRLVGLTYGSPSRVPRRLTVPLASDAEAEYQAGRASRRAADRQYKAERETVIARLRGHHPEDPPETVADLAAQLGWEYREGQQGGILRRPGCRAVSAPSVLLASGWVERLDS